MRQRAILAAATVALGVAAAAVLTPAFAAGTPTISAPAVATGYSEITISGTAAAGATVTLYESAYIWNDLYAATDYDTGATLTATASSTGAYAIKRYVDSGFIFEVEADGVRSKPVTVAMKVLPTLTVTATGGGSVTARVSASPAQPWLPVEIQRQSGSSWTKISGGYTDDGGAFTAALTGQGTSQTYRAYVGADPDNDIIANYSSTKSIGSGATPTTPAAGSVQFTKIQYHGPSGLNNEWVRLTNKTAKTISMSGWTVKDAAGNTYTFGSGYSLGSGKNVYVHTGQGTNGKPDSQHRYWGKTGYIWNNGGDTATLRAGSKSIDSCKWTSDKGVTYC